MFFRRIHNKNYACSPIFLNFAIKIEFLNLTAIFHCNLLHISVLWYFYISTFYGISIRLTNVKNVSTLQKNRMCGSGKKR